MSKNVEENLILAFDQMAPDCFDEIMKRLDAGEMMENEQNDIVKLQEFSEHEQFIETEEVLKKVSGGSDITDFRSKGKSRFAFRNYRRFFGAAATIAAAVCIVVGINAVETQTVGTIYIDVNPSISISYDKHEKVKEITAQNEDGEEILSEMSGELKDADNLSEAIDLVLNQLNEDGYFEDEADLLVSNCKKTDKKDVVTDADVNDMITDYAEDKNIDAKWVYQSFDENSEMQSKAKDKKMSVSKLHFLNEINESYQVETSQLEQKSVKEIFKYLDDESLDLDKNRDITVMHVDKSKGKGSDKTSVEALNAEDSNSVSQQDANKSSNATKKPKRRADKNPEKSTGTSHNADSSVIDSSTSDDSTDGTEVNPEDTGSDSSEGQNSDADSGTSGSSDEGNSSSNSSSLEKQSSEGTVSSSAISSDKASIKKKKRTHIKFKKKAKTVQTETSQTKTSQTESNE